MGIDIFADSDPNVNDEDLSKIEIDKDFARRFEHNKKREELQRYEELKKRGVVASSSSDDSSDDEDDDDEDLAEPQKDLKFYDALVRVKRGDPILNQKDAKLFDSSSDEEGEEDGGKIKKKEKPMYLKDANYQYLTEMGPESREEESNRNPKVYDRDQEENVKAFLEAEKEAFASDDGEDILKVKEGDEEEMEEDENAGEIQKRLDEYFGKDDNLNEEDAFLKSYFLNKMWVDKDKDKKPIFDDTDVSEDEDELDEQDRYEAEYNFRHEELHGDRILGHARVTEGSVRKKSSSRKAQRKSKEERVAQAEFERKEELKRLKNLKKKEIQEKLEKFREIAGIGKEGECKLGADDLEEDFDPEEYDKKMREIFDGDYYDAEDADPGYGSGGEDDLEKPDFEKEDELLGLPKDWDVCGSSEGFKAVREKLLKQAVEEEEPVKEEGKRKKKKRKISLKEKVELDKELEEYYKLDYEGTIGDLKTRFKYRPVPANSYGLRAEEILTADEKNLNQYVSLKRLAPYREKEWTVTYHQKLKKDLILHGGASDGNTKRNHGTKADNSIVRKRKKAEEHEETNDDAEKVNKTEEDVDTNDDTTKISKRMRRRRRQAELKLSRSRLMAYGKIPSKPKKKQ